jgi:hypothetical protein
MIDIPFSFTAPVNLSMRVERLVNSLLAATDLACALRYVQQKLRIVLLTSQWVCICAEAVMPGFEYTLCCVRVLGI